MWLEPARLVVDAHGTPISEAYDDVYHSANGGPAQSRHVFLGGNQLPERWQDRERFVILETGFGLGLNFLVTWSAWQADARRCQRLHFVSLEKHPFTVTDLATAHAAWPEYAPLADELRRHWPPLVAGMHRLNLAGGRVILTLVFGDAGSQLRKLKAEADAFYLDGFAPAKNPEPWSPEVCRALARLAAPGATLATWSVASELREALAGVEFDVEKRQGFTGKRFMLAGRYRSRKPSRRTLPADRRAIVLGAGIAGSTVAHRLAARGWRVTILDQAEAAGQGASGNIAGVLRPLPSIDDNWLARLTRAGYLASRALLVSLGDSVRWDPCGVMHLARDPIHQEMQRRIVAEQRPPPDYLQFLEAEAVSASLNWPVVNGGWWFPSAGWVQPPSFCQAAIAAYPELISTRFGTRVAKIVRTDTSWQTLDENGKILAQAPLLVVASGTEARQFEQLAWLPQRKARGQVSHIPQNSLPALDKVVCMLGYATPSVDGLISAGASFLLGDEETTERPIEHRDNLAKLNLILPGFTKNIDPATLTGRVGFRPASPDRLPMVGPVANPSLLEEAPQRYRLPLHPGLWCAQGYGSRGIVWSALMAELLASRIDGDPLPLENDLAEAVDPSRFILKKKGPPASAPERKNPLDRS